MQLATAKKKEGERLDFKNTFCCSQYESQRRLYIRDNRYA